MNNIIHQICENYISEVLDFFGGSELRKVDEIEKDLKAKTDRYIREMMKVYLEGIDEAIAQDKANRAKKGYVVERKADKREIYTVFGSLEFSRRYYKNKLYGQYEYLLDKAVGIENYDRVSGTVSAALVEHASEVSYQKSSKYVCNGDISRQTVKNKIRQINGLKVEAPKEKFKVKYIHVEADEDHVSMQDGTNTIVPLISIHEGIARNGKRGKCINIHHISSYGKSIEELWQQATEWIYACYDEDSIEKIYLHGDGAAWIKKGLEYLPKSCFVLDKYHLNQALKEVSCGDKILCAKLKDSVDEADKEYFKQLCREIRSRAQNESAKDKIDRLRGYILANWDGVAIYQDYNSRESNTEGHISHVLSYRLSSRPMGWSRSGLRSMTELRAYHCNGGTIEVKHITKTQDSYRLTKKTLGRVTKSFKKVSKEILHNITVLNYGKVSQLSRLLKNVRNSGYIF